MSWKVLLSGYVPDYLYDLGKIDANRHLPLDTRHFSLDTAHATPDSRPPPPLPPISLKDNKRLLSSSAIFC